MEALDSDDRSVLVAVCWGIRGVGGDPRSADKLRRIADAATDFKTRMCSRAAWMRSTGSQAWAKVHAKKQAAVMEMQEHRRVASGRKAAPTDQV
jgi:hypothetical protein